MKTKKVSKWDAAPESIKKLKEVIIFLFDRLEVQTYNVDDPEYKEFVDDLFKDLDKVLNDYNELEAKHNSDCGLISTLEADNDDLECELGKYKTIIKDLRHENEELDTELNEKKNVINEVEGKFKTLMDYLRDEWRFKVEYLPDVGTHNWHWHLRQVGPNQYNHDSNNFRYAFKEACRYIGMTPGQIADEVRWVRLSDTTGCDIIDRWKRMSEQAKPFRDDIKEALDKYKSQCDELKEKHKKATRFISALTNALNNAGVEFPCGRYPWGSVKNPLVKIGDDDDWIFRIDSVIDKCAKKHYEEQYNNLRDVIYERNDIIRELEFKIYKLKKDNEDLDSKYCDLMKENEKLLARNRKLTTGYNLRDVIYERNDIIRELESKIYKLKKDNEDLDSKYCDLMKENEKLLARNRKLTTGYTLYRDMFSSHYGLDDCHNCKNFDPKE